MKHLALFLALLWFSPLLRAADDWSVVYGTNGCYSFRSGDYVFRSLCYGTYDEAEARMVHVRENGETEWWDVTAPNPVRDVMVVF